MIYIYSAGDKTEGIEQPEFHRHYVLYFLMLFAMFGMLVYQRFVQHVRLHRNHFA
ncbi:MAG: hypothetical protein MZU97_21150 [Bacillus subtilis]|nr:hypothetical protein [Bacillus subtilis]